MTTEIVRDSCLMYEQLSYEQIDRLVNGNIAELLQQRELSIARHNRLKVCPICKSGYMGEGELCEKCNPEYDY